MWHYVMLGFSFAFAAAAQPGPTQAFLLSETMARGWRRALPASFAPLISDAPIVLTAIFLLSRLPSGMLRWLHLAGAAFLFYLVWEAIRNWGSGDADGDESARAPSTLWKAALVNFLNPNPWLGWTLVMGPLFLEGYRQAPVNGLALLASFYATLVAGFALIILIFGIAGRMGQRFGMIVRGLAICALAAFGLYQAWLGLGAGANL